MIKIKKNYFFFDIDGTLSIDTNILPSTIDSLNFIRNNNDKVLICTGHNVNWTKSIAKILKIDHYICSNGAVTIENNNITNIMDIKFNDIDKIKPFFHIKIYIYHLIF